MSKSSIVLNKDGSLDMVLNNQVELSESEKQELQRLERSLGQLSNAETLFKKEQKQLEIALMNVPDYQRMIKLREKTKAVRNMQRTAKIVLDAKYEQIFSDRGIQQSPDMYLDRIPDAPVKTGKRGRPRKERI